MKDATSNSTDSLPPADVYTQSGPLSGILGLSPIWIVPLISLCVALYIVYHTFSDTGPNITVIFKNASGIVADKTLVKYRDIEVGKVTDVGFSADLNHVIVALEMTAGADKWLTNSSRFWVVKPRIGKTGVSGLSTLLSGTYIELDPHFDDASDGFKDEYVGLEEPPRVESDTNGTMYKLRANELGSVSINTPVLYKGISVGKVTNYRFSEDHHHIQIDIFIDAPHDQVVRPQTRFWSASAVDLDINPEGIRLGLSSLSSIITGGIEFETELGMDAQQAERNSEFNLYASRNDISEKNVTVGLPFLLYFKDTVRGLSEGAHVEFRGIRVGTVKRISMVADIEQDTVMIPVLIEIEPERVRKELTAELAEIQAMLGRLVTKGLRARLQTANLVTGQLFVELDMFAKNGESTLTFEDGVPVIPTVPGTLSDITERLHRVLVKLEQFPLDKIGANLEKTTAAANALVSDNGLREALADVRVTLQQFNQTMSVLNQHSEPILSSTELTIKQANETLHVMEKLLTDANPAVKELGDAARSIRVMTEYLERHPEALIKGKK